jgi:hypothetical protein
MAATGSFFGTGADVPATGGLLVEVAELADVVSGSFDLISHISTSRETECEADARVYRIVEVDRRFHRQLDLECMCPIRDRCIRVHEDIVSGGRCGSLQEKQGRVANLNSIQCEAALLVQVGGCRSRCQEYVYGRT